MRYSQRLSLAIAFALLVPMRASLQALFRQQSSFVGIYTNRSLPSPGHDIKLDTAAEIAPQVMEVGLQAFNEAADLSCPQASIGEHPLRTLSRWSMATPFPSNEP